MVQKPLEHSYGLALWCDPFGKQSTTTVALNRGVGNKFPGGRESLRLLQHGNLITKFTNKYICFYSLFKVRGLETKDNCLREAW